MTIHERFYGHKMAWSPRTFGCWRCKKARKRKRVMKAST